MKTLAVLAIIGAGYALWSVFVYAPALGWPITLGLVGFSSLAMLAGILLSDDL